MSNKILELYTIPTDRSDVDWVEIILNQHCPYLDRRCQKNRKSEPNVTIGTCSVTHGKIDPRQVIICPFRFLDRSSIFFDCIHLLTAHEPGNELHKIAEVEIPGGSVDYFLVSVREGKVVDFVGIELQALDTTGTLWPARQEFLESAGLEIINEGQKPYGMNWKMTAKTILMQLHHKVETFHNLNRHLVLVMQDHVLSYMRREFNFSGLHASRLSDPMHFHAYALKQAPNGDYRLSLTANESTDLAGVATALGQQADPNVELEVILSTLNSKISNHTLLTLK